MSSYNGTGINSVTHEFSYTTTAYSSAYDCCVTCLLTSGCAASVAYGPADICDLFMDGGTCSSTNVVGMFETDPGLAPGAGFILSNSACGYIEYVGVN